MAELLTNTLPVDSEVSLDSFGPRKFAENDVTFAFFDRLFRFRFRCLARASGASCNIR